MILYTTAATRGIAHRKGSIAILCYRGRPLCILYVGPLGALLGGSVIGGALLSFFCRIRFYQPFRGIYRKDLPDRLYRAASGGNRRTGARWVGPRRIWRGGSLLRSVRSDVVKFPPSSRARRCPTLRGSFGRRLRVGVAGCSRIGPAFGRCVAIEIYTCQLHPPIYSTGIFGRWGFVR